MGGHGIPNADVRRRFDRRRRRRITTVHAPLADLGPSGTNGPNLRAGSQGSESATLSPFKELQ
jgi:hypothetical protein